METDTLKKILLYSAVAVVLGLLLTLVPLITLAEFRAENSAVYSFQAKMREIETPTYGGDTQTFSAYVLDVLAISFAIALVVYVLFKRRIPHDEYRWIREYPY
jgi:hypothetical protein